jgi:DNA-binding SARP family transcriptional activator
VITYQLLGPVVVRTSGGRRTPRGPKIGKVLALLALRPGAVVGVRSIAEELWEERPPRSALTTVRTHVYHLRRALGDAPEAGRIHTEPTGYRLAVDPSAVDAEVFTAAVGRGRALLASGAATEAAGVLRESLAMWRGPALADLDPGPVLARYVHHLEELRLAAMELRIEADLRLGRHRELVAELRALVVSHPLHEWFHARLIEALHRCGRRGEALRAYQDLRGLLRRELGVEPSVDLQHLRRDLLAAAS